MQNKHHLILVFGMLIAFILIAGCLGEKTNPQIITIRDKNPDDFTIMSTAGIMYKVDCDYDNGQSSCDYYYPWNVLKIGADYKCTIHDNALGRYWIYNCTPFRGM